MFSPVNTQQNILMVAERTNVRITLPPSPEHGLVPGRERNLLGKFSTDYSLKGEDYES